MLITDNFFQSINFYSIFPEVHILCKKIPYDTILPLGFRWKVVEISFIYQIKLNVQALII